MSSIVRYTVLILLALICTACGASGENGIEGSGIETTSSVTEIQVSDPRTALEIAMNYVIRRYSDAVPVLHEEWAVEEITPAGVVDARTYRFTAGSCQAIVGFPVVAPDSTLYQVAIDDDATEFHWQGEVDTTGVVTEKGAFVQAGDEAPDPAVALDQAVAYVSDHYPELLLNERMQWRDGQYIEGELVGFKEHGYTSGDWRGDVAFPIVAPESTNYHVILDNERIGFHWSGEVTFEGEVIEKSGPGHDTSGYESWNCFHNNELGYRVGYPADAAVLTESTRESVTFKGPITDGEHWPVLSIAHFDNELYHPPQGADLADWLAEHHLQSDTTGSEIEIAGIPTVHLVVAATPQSYGFDEFYFLRDGQLFRITLLHSAGRQDWRLYHFFLSSFTFEDLPEGEEDCEGTWTGTIVRNPAGAQNPYILITLAGQEFSLGSSDEEVQEQIDLAAWTGVRVRLAASSTEMPGHLGVERVEVVSEPVNDVRDLTPFATPVASSVLPADRLGTYDQWSAINGLLESPWCEGATGSGAGEWLQLDFPREVEVIRLAMSNGYDRSDELFFENNRVKEVRAIFSNGEEVAWSFADRRGMQSLVLARAPGPPITATWVRLVIEDVYPGSLYDDTCVGEVSVWGFGR